jgi:predicted transglutaminase-like cysteine proteinase
MLMGTTKTKVARSAVVALGTQLLFGHAQASELNASNLLIQPASQSREILIQIQLPSPSMSKSSAILGGRISALALISAQQNGQSQMLEHTPPVVSNLSRNAINPQRPVFDTIAAQTRPISASWVETAAAQPTFLKTNSPNIFGSIALRVSRTPLDAQWHRAGSNRPGSLAAVVAAFQSGSQEHQLARVNKWVNGRIKYSDDSKEYGVADHWASASQSLARGRGDCEDYAIAKMQILQALGYSRRDMYLAIVKDLVRRSDHAVLIVQSGGRFITLDNSTDELIDASAAQDYRPILTYSASGKWAHGYRREPVSNLQVAARATHKVQPALR